MNSNLSIYSQPEYLPGALYIVFHAIRVRNTFEAMRNYRWTYERRGIEVSMSEAHRFVKFYRESQSIS